MPKANLSDMLTPSFAPRPEEGMPEEQAVTVIDKASDFLVPEDVELLNKVVEMHPEMVSIIDTLASQNVSEGMISGPGTETSDSIDAKLSDGEFVFTAKAVKQLGVDKLRKLMAKAEQDFDEGQGMQEAASGPQAGFACGGFVSRRK